MDSSFNDSIFDDFAGARKTWEIGEEPLPLRRTLSDAEPYPIEALGCLLSSVAQTLKDVIQAPDALCGQSVLAAASLAAQSHRNIVVDGRLSPVSEYFITIGESGERKSAVDRVANLAARAREHELHVEHENQLQLYKDAIDLHKQSRDEVLKNKKLSGDQKRVALEKIKSPNIPIAPILVVEEPTYEGIVRLLSEGQPSIGLYTDEGGRLIGGHAMNEENQLKTAAGFSELWDGKPISRVRSGEGSKLLPGKRMSMHIMVQPVVAEKILGNFVLSGQGFLARCLMCWPSSNIGNRLYQAKDLTQSPSISKYNDQLLSLFRAPLKLRSGKQNELELPPISLDGKSKQLWMNFYNEIEGQLKEGRRYAPVRGLGSKIPEHALRLSGIISVVGDPNIKQISALAMDCGITLARYYLNEALRISHESSSSPDIVLAEKLLAWLKTRGRLQFYLAEVYQYGPYAIRAVEKAKRVIKILEDHGWIVRIEAAHIDDSLRKDVWVLRA